MSRILQVGTFLLAFVAVGCGSAAPEATSQGTTAPRFFASPTALATQPPETASAKPKSTPKATPRPTAKATPRPTAKAAAYYKPPGWDGYSDVNCTDFNTHAHAQSFFKGTGGSRTNDPYGLDRDHDGNACETLP